MNNLEQLVMKTRHASQGGFDTLSTGEKLAAALVLNRFDWLSSMNYTIAEAIERVGTEWMSLIPLAAKAVAQADATLRQIDEAAKAESVISGINDGDDTVDLEASLVTYGDSPGYRNVLLKFDVRRYGSATTHRLSLRIGPKDSESIMNHIAEVHRFAWRRNLPLDHQPGEQRPRWIDSTQHNQNEEIS